MLGLDSSLSQTWKLRSTFGWAVTVAVFVANVGAQGVSAPAPSAPITFDTTSVKLVLDPAIQYGMAVRASGLRMRRMTIKTLMAYTYGFRPERIAGGPAWLDSNEYEIIGVTNIPGTTTPMVKEMIKALLADRFQLRVHIEARPAIVYALVLARRDGRLGPALKKSAGCEQKSLSNSTPSDTSPRSCGARMMGERDVTVVEGHGSPLADLVWALDGTGGRKIVDKTSLTGVFDFTLRFAPALATTAEPGDAPDIYTALQEQLGLELKSEPGTVDHLVIEHIDFPSPN